MTCKVASNPVRKALHTTHNYPSIYLPGEAKPLRRVGEYIKANAAGGAMGGGRSHGERAGLGKTEQQLGTQRWVVSDV